MKKDKSTQKDNKSNAPKPPVNIFSKPLNVEQTEEAKRTRMRTVIIEALLFGAFITAITAVYSISGLELKMDPENGAHAPSLFFYFAEFVVFSIVVGVGDYFLTEKRVNDYNQKIAGLSFDIDAEIEKALKEQEAEGISEEETAKINKTVKTETPILEKLEIVPRKLESETTNFLTDMAFDAVLEGKKIGGAALCKGIVLDGNGMEQIVLKIDGFEVDFEYRENGVGKRLLETLKSAAIGEGFSAFAIFAADETARNFGFVPASKFNIKPEKDDGEELSVCELYPGALMGISGTYSCD